MLPVEQDVEVKMLPPEVVGKGHPEVGVRVADLANDDRARCIAGTQVLVRSVRDVGGGEGIVADDLRRRGALLHAELAERRPKPTGAEQRQPGEIGDDAPVEREGRPEDPAQVTLLNGYEPEGHLEASRP